MMSGAAPSFGSEESGPHRKSGGASAPRQFRQGGPTESRVLSRRTWRLASELSVIEQVVEEIVLLTREAGFSQKQCRFNIPIAVTEAISNAILRGNAGKAERSVDVIAVVSDLCLVVEVQDEGKGFDLEVLQQSPDDSDWFERENGRGVFLMRNLVDSLESVASPDNGRHCLRLTLNRA